MTPPRRNRVTPLGELIAHPTRGSVYGNRGVLHDRGGRIVRRHDGRRWIACRLAFRGRRRALLQPGRYTELFFLDEATALAAGHRPCAECRRDDYRRFLELWRLRHPGDASAVALDARLQGERLDASGPRLHDAEPAGLPDGAMLLIAGAPWLVHGPVLRRWTPAGYAEAVTRPTGGAVTVITPASTVAVLAAGYRPDAVPFIAGAVGAAGAAAPNVGQCCP